MVLAPTADGIADLHVVGRDAFGDATRRSGYPKKPARLEFQLLQRRDQFSNELREGQTLGNRRCRRSFNLLPCRYKVVDSREAGQKEGVPGFILTEFRNRLAPSVVTRLAKLVWHTKVRPSGMAARFL